MCEQTSVKETQYSFESTRYNSAVFVGSSNHVGGNSRPANKVVTCGSEGRGFTSAHRLSSYPPGSPLLASAPFMKNDVYGYRITKENKNRKAIKGNRFRRYASSSFAARRGSGCTKVFVVHWRGCDWVIQRLQTHRPSIWGRLLSVSFVTLLCRDLQNI